MGGSGRSCSPCVFLSVSPGPCPGWAFIARRNPRCSRRCTKRSTENRNGRAKFEDGTPVWEHFDDVQYMRRFPRRDSGLIVFANGKNDALSAGHRRSRSFEPCKRRGVRTLFAWGQNGHGERAGMPGGEPTIDAHRYPEQSDVAGVHESTLDGNPGNGSPTMATRRAKSMGIYSGRPRTS